MGLMMRKTHTILAVAITATTAACGGTTSEAGNHPMTQQELTQELSSMSLLDALKYHREHFAPLCDANGYPLPGNVNSKGGDGKVRDFCQAIGPQSPPTNPDPKPAPTTKPTPTPPPAPPPPPAPACDRNALNQELSGVPLESALTQAQHYRCLCDDKGYPLVGNINSKGTTASAFCSALKEKGLL